MVPLRSVSLWRTVIGMALLQVGVVAAAPIAEAELRLVPYPKDIVPGDARFVFPGAGGTLVLALTQAAEMAPHVDALRQELIAVTGCGLGQPVALGAGEAWGFALGLDADAVSRMPALPALPTEGWGEAYCLQVGPRAIVGRAAAPSGLANALGTCLQLIRANVQDGALPALTIRDWPSLRYRAFQDDMTRGPSSRLAFLQDQVRLGALFKMNLFTYYMEHQYAFQKHPIIGLPEADGGLGPEELRELVAFAASWQVDILGCQQSFGHFGHILKHEEYAHLREDGNILCPTVEESYALLNDLYSEQIPLVPFPMFNVCCDETQGLGRGPSAALAAEIGVGGVYAGHLARIHRILQENYGKRMMMWGDIILGHPENLASIPKDTVMLTWGYSARPSFTDQILPFKDSGYDFFVCPGVSCWSRILPDFQTANVNIQNFLRDGVENGAMGMINTAWDDDGETLGAPNWHGFLWGAECAWNGGTTPIDDFNRRVGAVFFGEKGDHFGQAVSLVTGVHSLAGFGGMFNGRFWEVDTARCSVSEAVIRTQADALLKRVTPALEHLRALKREARCNMHAIDALLFGTKRMDLIGRRMTSILDISRAASRALAGGLGVDEARTATVAPLAALRAEHAALRDEYEALWLAENEPYALDRVLNRYDALLATYDRMLTVLDQALTVSETNRQAIAAAAASNSQPRLESVSSLDDVGLDMVELGIRKRRADKAVATCLAPESPWDVPGASARLGLEITWPEDFPVGVAVPLCAVVPAAFARAGMTPVLLPLVEPGGGNEPSAMPVQVERLADETVLSCVVSRRPGELSLRGLLYLTTEAAEAPVYSGAVTVASGPQGFVTMTNDRVALVLGSEGGHIYEWRVAQAGGTDLTEPGDRDWAGFADVTGDMRSAAHQIEVLSRGPAVGRIRLTAGTGLTREFLLCAGQGWVEVLFNEALGWYWNYDDSSVFAPEGETPGTFVFSDGTSGAVGPMAAELGSQVARDGVVWAAKTRADGLTHALITPGRKTRLMTGPGGGWGGCGLERAPAVSHLVTVGDVIPADALATRLSGLEQALSLRQQPRVTLYAPEPRP